MNVIRVKKGRTRTGVDLVNRKSPTATLSRSRSTSSASSGSVVLLMSPIVVAYVPATKQRIVRKSNFISAFDPK